MGFHVAAVDVGEEKLDLARKLGAQIAVGRARRGSSAQNPE
jgi:D-arabinose 1-dehydrogenase-like Zn-dependent alcohol dehydrogenase